MLKNLALIVGLVTFVGVVLILINYNEWRNDRLSKLADGSSIANTSLGPIEYVLRGQNGPIILFLHGILGGYDQAPTEAPKGYRLLAPSRPGYLSTPLDVGDTPKEQAKAYAVLLNTLGIEEVVVIGASAGGPSAIFFASMYPQRTLALIALESIVHSYPNDTNLPLFMKSDFIYWFTVSAILKLKGVENLVVTQIAHADNKQRILSDNRKIDEFLRLTWSLWPLSLRKDGWQNDMLQINQLSLPVRNVKAPTLVIHGTNDQIVPFSHGKYLADAITSARIFSVQGGDHTMPISHKEEVDQAIVSFISEYTQAWRQVGG